MEDADAGVWRYEQENNEKTHCWRNSKKVDKNGQRPIPLLTAAAAFIYFRTNIEIVNCMLS